MAVFSQNVSILLESMTTNILSIYLIQALSLLAGQKVN